MNGFAALDIHPHRRYVVDIGGRRSSRCRLHINFALFLRSLDFTQNLGVTQFTTPKANLHPDVISNLEMGYIFEEIIRRFSESHNEDAGQHYTPREVIQLMANILFYDDNEFCPARMW